LLQFVKHCKAEHADLGSVRRRLFLVGGLGVSPGSGPALTLKPWHFPRVKEEEDEDDEDVLHGVGRYVKRRISSRKRVSDLKLYH